MKTNNKGFSLVELIVVIAIMAILAAVAIPTFATFINKANVASDVSFINDLEYSAQLAHTATADTVKNVKVTLKADGTIEKATYEVYAQDGTTKKATVTITVNSGTGTAAVANESGYVVTVEDATTASATIDWSYKFKSTKAAGTYQIDTNDAKKISGPAA